jgi:hypothetical protein
VSSNLPDACQQLYANVTGKKIILDDDDFPEFSQAIQHSCTTPGCWAYETLEAKATEFDKTHPDRLQTYLRITLGYNGVRYSLKQSSPITELKFNVLILGQFSWYPLCDGDLALEPLLSNP